MAKLFKGIKKAKKKKMEEVLKFKVNKDGQFLGLSRGDYDLVEDVDYKVEVVEDEAVAPEESTPEVATEVGEEAPKDELTNQTEESNEQKKNEPEPGVPEVEEEVSPSSDKFEPGETVKFTTEAAVKYYGQETAEFVEYMTDVEVKVKVGDKEEILGVEGITK